MRCCAVLTGVEQTAALDVGEMPVGDTPVRDTSGETPAGDTPVGDTSGDIGLRQRLRKKP